jgi:CubicO group peptidase (beta-lactamase class C family)
MDFDRIVRRLTELARENAVPGVQLAVHHGGLTRTFEFGEQEHATGRAVSRDSKMPIGSISKMCTATLAMMLVADGDLELDAPISTYLPDVRSSAKELSGQLTLRHLLSHTGGLASDPVEIHTASQRRQVLACCTAIDPLHRPGAAFSYSNTGYVLAGHLIEVVTGMTWWEAVDAILFQPLGIAPHFVVAPADAPRAGMPVVTGHSVNAVLRRVRPVRQSLTLAEAPAGAVAASAIDLIALGRLHCQETGEPRPRHLIGPAALREMSIQFPRAEPFGMADGWGLGLALYRNGATTWLGHDGTADGTACHLRIEPSRGTVVAMTSNGSTGMLMWQELVDEMNAAGLPVGRYDGRRRLTRRTPAPAGCLGSYFNGDTEYVVTVSEQGRILLKVDDEPFAYLTMYDDLLFSMCDVETGDEDQTGRFLTDRRTGQVEWIQIGGRLARQRGRASEVA